MSARLESNHHTVSVSAETSTSAVNDASQYFTVNEGSSFGSFLADSSQLGGSRQQPPPAPGKEERNAISTAALSGNDTSDSRNYSTSVHLQYRGGDMTASKLEDASSTGHVVGGGNAKVLYLPEDSTTLQLSGEAPSNVSSLGILSASVDTDVLKTDKSPPSGPGHTVTDANGGIAARGSVLKATCGMEPISENSSLGLALPLNDSGTSAQVNDSVEEAIRRLKDARGDRISLISTATSPTRIPEDSIQPGNGSLLQAKASMSTNGVGRKGDAASERMVRDSSLLRQAETISISAITTATTEELQTSPRSLTRNPDTSLGFVMNQTDPDADNFDAADTSNDNTRDLSSLYVTKRMPLSGVRPAPTNDGAHPVASHAHDLTHDPIEDTSVLDNSQIDAQIAAEMLGEVQKIENEGYFTEEQDDRTEHEASLQMCGGVSEETVPLEGPVQDTTNQMAFDKVYEFLLSRGEHKLARALLTARAKSLLDAKQQSSHLRFSWSKLITYLFEVNDRSNRFYIATLVLSLIATYRVWIVQWRRSSHAAALTSNALSVRSRVLSWFQPVLNSGLAKLIRSITYPVRALWPHAMDLDPRFALLPPTLAFISFAALAIKFLSWNREAHRSSNLDMADEPSASLSGESSESQESQAIEVATSQVIESREQHHCTTAAHVDNTSIRLDPATGLHHLQLSVSVLHSRLCCLCGKAPKGLTRPSSSENLLKASENTNERSSMGNALVSNIGTLIVFIYTLFLHT